ncbi:30 kDa salivary gland allergen Aed a 3-like isoform X3 [Anopheles coustani]|uniref:30 kDa salivary gland allergen Aed a 3-like isoform X3 n=1 Tax=Anopheles coustani TaxID=139045 RepID=UPI00265A4DBE|nr:30 kDa salivary gland allergen Aed a 3-like isoform X3 [Anopheles coustani]
MKFLLVLAGVLCVALIVSARPADEEADQGTGTDVDAGAQEGDDEAAAGDDTETDGDQETEDGEGTGDTEGADDATDEGGDDAEGDGDAAEGDEGSEDGEAGDGEEGGEAGDGEEGGEDGEGGDGEEGREGGAKETARNTYRQVHKLLKKIMKVDMKDKYLKSYVVGRLQERLMNPTIDLVNTIEKYSKIKSCFSSLEKDVQGLVKESEKSYAECKKENSNGDCGNEGTRELDEGLIDREQELSDCIVDKRDAE